jgi:hypothetical protein
MPGAITASEVRRMWRSSHGEMILAVNGMSYSGALVAIHLRCAMAEAVTLEERRVFPHVRRDQYESLTND